jgi:hypothetical protein
MTGFSDIGFIPTSPVIGNRSTTRGRFPLSGLPYGGMWINPSDIERWTKDVKLVDVLSLGLWGIPMFTSPMVPPGQFYCFDTELNDAILRRSLVQQLVNVLVGVGHAER